LGKWIEKAPQLIESIKKDCHLLSEDGWVLDFRNEPDVISLIVGDLHGDMQSLLDAFSFFEAMQHEEPGYRYRWIFLGDYVDRGEHSIEVLDFLLQERLKRLSNDREDEIYLLRGNHEDWFSTGADVRSPVAPGPEAPLFITTLEPERQRVYLDLFSAMPCAALLPCGVLAVHGGIPKPVGFPPKIAFPEINDVGSLDNRDILSQMLWGDPVDVDFRIITGTRFEFGRKQCETFLDKLGLSMIIRGHEAVSDGFDSKFDGRAVTVFSSGATSEESCYPGVLTPAVLLLHGNHYSVFRRVVNEAVAYQAQEFEVPCQQRAEEIQEKTAVIEKVESQSVIEPELPESKPVAEKVSSETRESEASETLPAKKETRPTSKELKPFPMDFPQPVVYKKADIMFIIDLQDSPELGAMAATIASFFEQLSRLDGASYIKKEINLTVGFLNPALDNKLQIIISSREDKLPDLSVAMLEKLLGGKGGESLKKNMDAMVDVLEHKVWSEDATRYLIVLTASSGNPAGLDLAQIIRHAALRKIIVWVLCRDLDQQTMEFYSPITSMPRCACVNLGGLPPDWEKVFLRLAKSITATV